MSLNKRLMSSQPAPFVASGNFGILTWTGNNSNSRAITGLGFKPDWVWIKRRNSSEPHAVYDSTRGPNKQLEANDTDAEATNSGDYLGLPSFDTDGFTVGNNGGTNRSGNTYVAWCWKANGGTTSTNSNGSINSTVQTNSDTGFSIVKFTGTGAQGTIGHGLSSAPELIISKRLDATNNWNVYHKDLGLSHTTYPNWLYLNLNSSEQNSGSNANHAYYQVPSSTLLYQHTGTSESSNVNNGTYISYCFHSVDGFSKFGSYTGNGSADGPIVETGFEPAFLMLKRTDDAGSWAMIDNTRTPTNPRNLELFANLADADNTFTAVDFLSNGFQIINTSNTYNASDDTFIYMAFAADPDEVAPTLASSFEIQTYDMTGGADKDISFAFKPQFVITKTRDEGAHWSWNDIVRGADSSLASNDNNAASSSHQWRVKDWHAGATSVTIAQHASTDTANISYAWKADDNEPTITGGPAVAVYKFEDNANDVTGNNNASSTANVTYTSSGKFNKAAVFNGSNAYMNLSNGSFRFRHLTISVWVKPAGSGHRSIIENYDYQSSASKGFILRIDNSTGKARFVIYNGDCDNPYPDDTDCSNVTAVVSTSAIATNAYTHIVITMNPDELKMYINGELDVSTQTQAIGYHASASTNIGRTVHAFATGGEAFYNGEIDQLRIYSGAITDTEVATLYAETAGDNDNLSLVDASSAVISANPNAGFSIVKYEGTQGLQKIPHGLSAAPNMIIAKNISDGSTSWTVFHSSLGAGKILRLENAADEIANDAFWGGTSNAPNATTFTVGVQNDTNAEDGSLNEIIAYCFHDVSGYQKFGSYTGSGNTGNTVTVGFQPDFVMVKSSDEDEPWFVLDSKRDTSNPRDNRLMFDASNAEDNGSVHTIDFNSNNFVLDGTTGNGTNGSGKSYIYWALKINSIQIDYLVIAGGGGGGNGRAGGGGAGGYIYATGGYSTAGTVYTITVGDGGAAGASGSNSVFGSVTAIGGGRGGSTDGTGSAAVGGSGGGGAGLGTTTEAGAAGTSGQGNAGGHGYYTGSTQRNGGGGGGSAATGGNASANTSGNGGNGTASSITGSSVTRAGGGGGGDQLSGEGSGGSGGGGNGGRDTSINATAGAANTGSGGGGGGGTGGAGGSGIVILRLLTSDYTGTTSGSPTVTTDGSYTVLQYTSSGTYTA